MQPSRILSQRWQTFVDDPRVVAAKERAVRVARTAKRLRPTFADQSVRVARGWVKRKLPRRFHAITHELAKFGTIGLLNLGVNFAVVNVLWFTILSGSEVKAKAVATVVAATSAYFMNRHWTYRDRPKSTLRREYTLFFFFNLVGLVIEVAVLYVAKYGLGQTHLLVLNLFTAVGIVLGTAFRFWAYRTHVFKIAPDVPEEALATPYELVEVADSDADVDQGSGAPDRKPAGEHAVDRGLTDRALNDELTQIELEDIVASEQRPAPTP